MNSQKAFSGQAENYVRFRPVYPEALYRFILGHVSHKKTAWDCGTGSGQAAGTLADHFETVYASDINSEQLKFAVKKANIRYNNVPAEQTPYLDNFFDLITVAQAIHWFDFDAFYKEARRVAHRNALIAVFGYGFLETEAKIDPIIRKLYKDAFGSFYTESRKYVDEQYKTIPFPFDEIPSPNFSIPVRWTPEQLDGYFNSWSAIQAYKEQRGYNPAEEAMEKITSITGPEPIEGTFSVFLRLGRVHCTM